MPDEKKGLKVALFEQSSYREILVEHLFVGELLRTLWPHRVEVMKPQVDDGGYDLVMEAGGVIRHVQLKSSTRRAKTARQNVHQDLREKPSGCVIWIQFDEDEFELGPFLWFGNSPDQPLPDLTGFRVAKHTKGDSTGVKKERPAIRVIPKGKFREVNTIVEVAEDLFGELDELRSPGS